MTEASGPLEGGGTRYEYQFFDAALRADEDLVPLWVDQQAILRQSADKDWGHIVEGLGGHYRRDWPLGRWEARVDALRPPAGAALTLREMMAALNLVQGEIFDPGLTWSAGEWRANLPAEVAASGFGTVVDKALLLRTMLVRLGFEADVALTSSVYGPVLDRLPPSMRFLDTAVVRVRHDGKDWWLDPSMMAQDVPAEAMTPLRYGFALPLREGSAVPVAIPADPVAIWSSDVRETWRLTPAGLFLDVVSEHHGESADDLRYRFAYMGIAEISSELHEYYRSVFPEMVMIRQPDLVDDPANNRVEMHERYFLSNDAIRRDDLKASFPLAAEDFAAGLSLGDNGLQVVLGRKWPLAGLEPGRYRHRVELRGNFGMLEPPQAVHVENMSFRYAMNSFVPKAGQLVIEWDFLSSGADIPPADLAQVLADAKLVYDTTWYEFDLERGQ